MPSESRAPSTPISLGIDLGTSRLKVVLLSAVGQVLGTASAPITTSCPQAGWAEQDPDDWWNACLLTLRELRLRYPAAYAEIRCVGLSGQMHGAVLLNRRDEPVRPAIIWNDARSTGQAVALSEQFAAHVQQMGSLPMAGLTAPQLLWLSEYEPENFRAIDCLVSPKDYIRLKLTGDRMTDMSDAAGTLFLNVQLRSWFGPMIEACRLDARQFPALAEGTAATGMITGRVAQELGFRDGVVVACGAGDNPASAVGLGASNPGDSFVTLGTSAAVVSFTDAPLSQIERGVHGFCHGIPARWYGMGAVLCGASCLRWASKLLSIPSEQALLDLVSKTVFLDQPAPDSAPLFLPYLTGERTPHNDPYVRGGFMNVGIETSTALFGYSVLEGVAFALRDAMTSVEASGLGVGVCSLVGGGAVSEYWAQLLANVLGRELRTLEGSELAAGIGAAKLGFAALGFPDAHIHASLPAKKVFVPHAASADQLNARYEKFLGLYSAAQTLYC